MTEESKVVDLGMANGWDETPKIVKKCMDLNHQTQRFSKKPYLWNVRCDVCGYKYQYDSSG